jgi:hypothetical protein
VEHRARGWFADERPRVMKVGLDIGVIGPELFTMLLVMAIVTTVMTTPLLALFSRSTPALGEVSSQIPR